MDPSSWKRIEEIYHQVLDASPAQRPAVLEERCGADAALRREVESLLAANDDAGEFLLQPPHLPLRRAEPGTKLGSYEIESLLGAGAMGEVYRARDTRLDRPVALKLLSTPYRDPAREARFQLEAKAASALNHPNIVTIYEIGQAGQSWYIAQELIDGVTLREKMSAGRLPGSDAVAIMAQCCAALAAAHQARMIHRDIKPENIMIRPDGVVKVVDFGLARIFAPASGSAAEQATQTGAIMGTPRYMSPEQARGEKLDQRTDIFSLGSILYEVIAGRPAFPGSSTAEVFAALISPEPPPETATAFDGVIGRALAKRRETRLANMEQFAAELRAVDPTAPPRRRLRLDAWFANRSAGRQPGSESKELPPKPWSKWIGVAAAGLVVAIVAVVASIASLPRNTGAPTSQLEAVPLTAYDGFEMQPSFSVDGGQIVFAWNGPSRSNYDIYVKAVAAGAPVRLTTDAASDFDPVWSPDGTEVAFCRQGRGIVLIPPAGGTERTLFEDPDMSFAGYRHVALSARRLGWSPDGKYLAFARAASVNSQAGIFLITSHGGQAKRITLNETDADWAPAFSPDGGRLAFVRCASPSSCRASLVDLDSDMGATGPVHQLTEPSGYVGSIAWTPDGQSIIFSQADVGPVSLRLWRLPVGNPGQARLLSFAGPGSDSVTISRSGSRMAYSYFYGDADLWKMEGGTASRSSLSSTRRDDSPQFSPDGTRMAFSSDRAGHQEIWVADVDGSNAIQLTTSRASGTARWSPDGKRLVYDTQAADGLWDIKVIGASGGTPIDVVHHPADDKAPSFSRDGRWIYFASNRDGRDEIYRIPAIGGEAVRLTDKGGYVAFEAMDGGSIYYTKTGVGCRPLFTRSLNGGPERQMAESVCERGFVVHPNGIYLLSNNLNSNNVDLMLLDPVSGKSRVVATGVGKLDLGLAVSPDAKTIFFSMSTQDGADLMLVEGLR